MENNVLLGAINRVDVPIFEASEQVVTTGPVDSNTRYEVSTGPAAEGSVGPRFIHDVPGYTFERIDIPVVDFFAYDNNGGNGNGDSGNGSNGDNGNGSNGKKNMLLFGIAGVVLAYLLFRKK